MIKNNYICALDIGSSKIAAVVAGVKKKRIASLFFESGPARGFRHGTVVDAIAAVGCIGAVLKGLKTKSGINIRYVHTNISGQDILIKHSKAIIPLAERGNKVITLSDVARAREQARILGSSLEEEILHQIPYSFAIDSASDIANPVGLYSHKLEIDVYLVCGKLSSTQTLARLVNQAGYEIKDLAFTGIATSAAVFDGKLKSGTTVLCDIGSDITEILLFKDGLLRDIAILEFGGEEFSYALSQSLKIPLDLAEEVKKSYGMAGDSGHIKEDKEILIKKNNSYKPIKQKLVAEITTAVAKTSCVRLKEALDKMVPCDRIDNFIVCGRGIMLEGFLEMLESSLGVSVRLGRLSFSTGESFFSDKENTISGQSYLNYVTSLGILSHALSADEMQAGRDHSAESRSGLLWRAVGKFKEVYQEYF